MSITLYSPPHDVVAQLGHLNDLYHRALIIFVVCKIRDATAPSYTYSDDVVILLHHLRRLYHRTLLPSIITSTSIYPLSLLSKPPRVCTNWAIVIQCDPACVVTSCLYQSMVSHTRKHIYHVLGTLYFNVWCSLRQCTMKDIASESARDCDG